MRRSFIWDDPDWPGLSWDTSRLSTYTNAVYYEQGRLLGQMSTLGFDLQLEAFAETLSQDVHKTSDIEGERLDLEQIRSSVARRLGLETGGYVHVEHRVEGIVDVMMDATGNYHLPLTRERLWDWQAALFPGGRSGMTRIIVGNWRDDSYGPMQVVSGPIGKERVHFEAPPAERVDHEMGLFLDWFNNSDEDWVTKAGVAHLWFVTVHPFDDGNGRLARAVSDMALARSERTPQRFYSMSSQIRAERKDYYRALEGAQRGTLDITTWLDWFMGCTRRAVVGAEDTLGSVLAKARFWRNVQLVPINDRQRKMLNLLLGDFKGNLTTSKWAKITKCSHDTALRDIAGLIDRGVLAHGPAGGRSTTYHLEPDRLL